MSILLHVYERGCKIFPTFTADDFIAWIEDRIGPIEHRTRRMQLTYGLEAEAVWDGPIETWARAVAVCGNARVFGIGRRVDELRLAVWTLALQRRAIPNEPDDEEDEQQAEYVAEHNRDKPVVYFGL